MSYQKRFRVEPGTKVNLKEVDPGFTDQHEGHKQAAQEIERCRTKLGELQHLLYADRRHALLICLQGMDTAGKDGTINHVLGAMNPQGCRVAAFKQPTAEELAHDFLWRMHRVAPARGEVVIFNRSQYEDVLVVRVHNLVSKGVWSRRFDRINEFEQALVDSDIQVLKFFLHISKDEQLRRFKDRLDDPAKQWKVSQTDLHERRYWDQYMVAYEDVLSNCSTREAPWFIIPSDHKWFRNLAIGRIVVEHLEGLDMKFPAPAVDLAQIRAEYREAKKS